jgi:hypothetical protein
MVIWVVEFSSRGTKNYWVNMLILCKNLSDFEPSSGKLGNPFYPNIYSPDYW